MSASRLFDFHGMGWRNPFAELERLQREMNRLFGEQRAGRRGFYAGVFPAVNVTEDKNNYYIRAELPGIEADDLDIQATGRSLTISGERKIPVEGDHVRYHRREREEGKFSRIINLPEAADMDKVNANLADGILTVMISKSEISKPRRIAIN